MDIDVKVRAIFNDGQLNIQPSLNSIVNEPVAIHSFDLVFHEGSTIELTRKDAPQPDLTSVAEHLLSGHPVWFRARVHYEVGRTRTGYLIKDFYVERTEKGDLTILKAKVREKEAMGTLAYWSQDFEIASRLFDTSLKVYEGEGCTFAIKEMMQAHAYVLLFTGRAEEAAFHLKSLLNMDDNREITATRLRLLGSLANILIEQGQVRAARDSYKQILNAAKELDRSEIGFAEAGIGNTYKAQGKNEEAEKWLRRAVDTARRDEDRMGFVRRLSTLGFLQYEMGQPERALASLTESMSVAMDIGDFQYVENQCRILWEASRETGESTPFITTCERFIRVLPENLAIKTRIHVLNALAVVYYERSDYLRAIERCEEALAIARRMGDQIYEAVLLGKLSENYSRTGRYSKAQELCRESMRIAAEYGAWPLANVAKKTLARVISESGNDSGDELAESEYVEILADWWFSQSPNEKAPNSENSYD